MSDTDQASASSSPPPTPSRKINLAVPLVVSCGFFMNQLDSTIIGTSIPQIAESLGESPLRLNVAITSYLISLAVFVPISGWIADRFGARRVFCCAIAIFTLSSAFCGLATDLWMMVAMRIVQGFGGALMNPVGRLILIRSFPKNELLAALSFVSIPALVGPTVGPLIGGFLTTYASWRWIFFINIPIGIIGIFFALRHIQNFAVSAPPRFDFKGFVIVAVGLALLEIGLEYSGRHALPGWALAALFIGAVAFLGAYVAHALTNTDPVLDLRLFKIRSFGIAWGAGGLCHMAIGALPFLLPLMLQVGFGLDPLQSGLLTFVTSIGAMVMRTVAPRVVRRFGMRRLLIYNSILLGLMVGGIGFFEPTTPHWILLTYLFLYGVVRATQFTNVQALGFSALTPPIMSKGTSLSSVVQQVCSSFGIAAAATVLALMTGPAETIGLDEFRYAFILIGLLPLLAMFAFIRLRPTDGAEVASAR